MALLVGFLALAPSERANADVAGTSTAPIAAASIATGFGHTCVVTETQAVRCWGDGASGKLGYGNTQRVGAGDAGFETAAVVGDMDLGGDAVAVGVGRSHSCALLTTGAVRCWGSSEFGQLGYGTTATVGAGEIGLETPADAGDVPLGGTAVAISVSENQTCALLTTQALRCWGENVTLKLGYGAIGNVGDDETPAQVGDVPATVPVAAVSVGVDHTCVLSTTGTVHCWGIGTLGRLGYGSEFTVGAEDAGPVDLGGTAVAVSAGSSHTCAVLTAGALRCWGGGSLGQLGYGNPSNVGDGNVDGLETPADAGDVPLGGLASGVAAGSLHTCATLTTGTVKCWGFGLNGRTGYANTDNIGDGSVVGKETPGDVGTVDVGGPVLAVSADIHSCAVLEGGALRCWGHPTAGKLGYGVVTPNFANVTPASAGSVPVGALVQTVAPAPPPPPPVTPPVSPVVKKPVTLTLKAMPKRDRRAPFIFRLRGAATGSFAKAVPACRGTVTVVIKRGPRQVAQRRVLLRSNCTYAAQVKVRPAALGKKKRLVRLVVVARFGGNAVLLPDAVQSRVVAR